MNDKELGKVLSGQSADGDAAIVQRVINRDRWRVRLLAGATIALWVLAAATLVASYAIVVIFAMPAVDMVANPPAGDTEWVRKAARSVHTIVVEVGWPMVVTGGMLLTLAALGTVLLVLYSRQAALRQIDRRLELILAGIRRTA